MNVLPIAKQVQIINLLVEGNSLRSTSRITGTSITTVTKLLIRVGKACQKFHDERVLNITAKRVQCDEIWSFVYAKQKNIPEGMEDRAGDVWTWVGIDAETKLVISYYVGNRTAEDAHVFMHDISDRLANMVQLTTDGNKMYLEAVESSFKGVIDYAKNMAGIG